MAFWPCLTPPTVLLNNIPVQRSTFQKHFGVYLDEKLNFNTDITEKIGKTARELELSKSYLKVFQEMPYEPFIYHLLDPTKIMVTLCTINLIMNHLLVNLYKYNAALEITGAIKCASRSKLYNELGLESLESRRRLRHLCFHHKVISNRLPAYLYKLIFHIQFSETLC